MPTEPVVAARRARALGGVCLEAAAAICDAEVPIPSNIMSHCPPSRVIIAAAVPR